MQITQQRLNELCLSAATQERPEISAWLRERASEDSPQLSCVPTAAYNGDLKILQWLRAQNCPWDDACSAAARCGRLEILQWLRSQELPCPWNEQTCTSAAIFVEIIGRSSSQDNLQPSYFKVLQWLRAQNPPCPWNEHTCSNVARCGHSGLKVLQWLRAQDPPCPWGEHTCSLAAISGHLDVLQWVRAQDPPCPWSEHTCSWAARRGHLKVLQWLRAEDPPCPWRQHTCASAAGSGHLQILQWLRAQDPPCPWVETIFERCKSRKIIGWALLYGCPAPPGRESLRTQLVFLTCIKHVQHTRFRNTRSRSFADHLLNLPPDIIRHIARFL